MIIEAIGVLLIILSVGWIGAKILTTSNERYLAKLRLKMTEEEIQKRLAEELHDQQW